MLILIDGSSYMHRAFHIHKHLSRASDGQPVGAVFGFTKLVWDLRHRHDHTHIAVVFDGKGGSHKRFALHSAYKGNRQERDAAFTSQHGLVRKAAGALALPCVEPPGHEADDVIATIARKGNEAGLDVTIFTNDKDFMQLLRPGLSIFDWLKGRYLTEDDCLAKFGVAPRLVPHVQALWGDAIDNIPGVPGVGTVNGRKLINRWGGLEEALAGLAASESCGCTPQIRAAILANAEAARLSLQLATLYDNADDDVPEIEALRASPLDVEALQAFLEEMEFVSLKRRWFGEQAA